DVLRDDPAVRGLPAAAPGVCPLCRLRLFLFRQHEPHRRLHDAYDGAGAIAAADVHPDAGAALAEPGGRLCADPAPAHASTTCRVAGAPGHAARDDAPA